MGRGSSLGGLGHPFGFVVCSGHAQFPAFPSHILFCFVFFTPCSSGKEPVCQYRRHKRHGFDPLGREDPLEVGTATLSSVLSWRISRTEEPGGLWSIGTQRVRHDRTDLEHSTLQKQQLGIFGLFLPFCPCCYLVAQS